MLFAAAIASSIPCYCIYREAQKLALYGYPNSGWNIVLAFGEKFTINNSDRRFASKPYYNHWFDEMVHNTVDNFVDLYYQVGERIEPFAPMDWDNVFLEKRFFFGLWNCRIPYSLNDIRRKSGSKVTFYIEN